MSDNHHQQQRLEQVKVFLENEIVPRYDNHDAGHGRDHAHQVMSRALQLAAHYPEVDPAIVLTAAAYHDVGLAFGREEHHIHSARIVREDDRLRQWFSDEEIEIIAQAAQDHRASSGHEPRSLYGKIIAEADRLIEPTTIVRRAIQYGLDHYPELSVEEQYQRTRQHLVEKYGTGGYLRLWLPVGDNAQQLEKLRQLIADEGQLRELFDQTLDLLKKSACL